MAKIGLRNFYYSVATVNSTTGILTYSGATKPGKAVSFNFDPTVSNAELYADDALAESDTSVNGGSCTMGIDRYDLATAAALLGHTESGDVVTSNVDDVAPYVGLGRIVTIMQDGALKYRAVFFPKVKFQEGSSSDTTKGQTTEFGTYELTGTVSATASGDWRKEKVFDTQSAADSWLQSLMTGQSSN